MKKFYLLTLFALLLGSAAATARTVYFNGGWSAAPYAYVYDDTSGSAVEYHGSWPGTALNATSYDGWCSLELASGAGTTARIIFNTNGGSERYPADNDPGVLLDFTGEEGWYLLSDKTWYSSKPNEKPVVVADPSSSRFSESVTVSLSCSLGLTIHYTTDGSEPTASSQPYSQPLTFTETTTLKTYVDNSGTTNVQSFTYTKSSGGGGGSYPSLSTSYYKTNPDGKVGSNRTINMSIASYKSSTALSSWTDAELIAQGVANDVCQMFRGGHEYPFYDSYALYAAYDATYLYIGCQFVNVFNVDKGNSKPYNSPIPMCIALDLDPSLDLSGEMEAKSDNRAPWMAKHTLVFENGMDCLIMFSSKEGGTPAIFLPKSDGTFSYDENTYCIPIAANSIGYADGLLPSITSIYGQGDPNYGYDPALLEGESGFSDLIDTFDSDYHTFYEIKIPLATLGISESYIKNTGIGVMWISTYGASGVGSIPYDPTVYDNVFTPYSADGSSSAEKEDVDTFTYAMARVGRASSAVEEVEEESVPFVSASAGVISINAASGEQIAVYDLVGNPVFRATSGGDRVDVNAAPGIYIVKAGANVAKIRVQ